MGLLCIAFLEDMDIKDGLVYSFVFLLIINAKLVPLKQQRLQKSTLSAETELSETLLVPGYTL